jgi:cytochrome c oxidase subunit 2
MDQARRRLCLAALAAAAMTRVRRFFYSPNRIALKAREPVVLAFTAIDFVHGFNVPELHLRADLIPGRVVYVPLRFDKAGEYDFLCDNFCGDGHEGMNGKFVVAT